MIKSVQFNTIDEKIRCESVKGLSYEREWAVKENGEKTEAD